MKETLARNIKSTLKHDDKLLEEGGTWKRFGQGLEAYWKPSKAHMSQPLSEVHLLYLSKRMRSQSSSRESYA